jgi:hypothetical protein
MKQNKRRYGRKSVSMKNSGKEQEKKGYQAGETFRKQERRPKKERRDLQN